MFDFSNKVVIVSGAAGNLGQAVVAAFLAAGGTVCAVDHQKGRLADILDSSPAHDKLFIIEGVDVTKMQQVADAAQQVDTLVGKADILVNTVGGYAAGERVYQLSNAQWQMMMDLNVHSFLNLSAAFVPAMQSRGSGKIVTIGAKSGLQGGAGSGAYSAAKAALLRLTESLAAELKENGIQVNCVLPAIIDTPQNRKAMPQADFSKWVSPEKLAEVILFLCSPASDAITGAAIPVYGSA